MIGRAVDRPDMAPGGGLPTPERELIAPHPDIFSSWALLPPPSGDVAEHHRLHAITKELPELISRAKTPAFLHREAEYGAAHALARAGAASSPDMQGGRGQGLALK